jgi:ribosome-associated protein
VSIHRGARAVSGGPIAGELSPRALADLVVDTASDKKAEDIVVMNVSEVTTIADLFVILSGRGERQVQGIAEGIIERSTQAGRRPYGVEGLDAGRWVLIDLGDVIVHAFVPEERELYKLERLWGDAPVVLRVQ